MMKRFAIFAAISLLSFPSLAVGPHPVLTGIAAAADDANVAGTNPAGMTRFKSRATRAEVIAFFPDNTWQGTLEDGSTFESYDDDVTVIPQGNIVMPIADNYWFGFTVLGFGFSEDYGDNWPGRYALQEYDLLYVSAFPSIATKLNDNWSVAGSLAITYTSYEQTKAVRNLDQDYDDGKLTLDADGFSLGFALSTLYELNEYTRFGFSYHSELDPELDGNADFSNLSPTTESILDKAGLLGAPIDVKSTSPQSIIAGLYHEFENSHALTLDLVWSDFSEFTLSEIYLKDYQLTESDIEYDDIYAASVGYSWPLNSTLRIGVGAMYADDMVDDEERSLTLRLDSLWSAGIGLAWQWQTDKVVNFNLSYLKLSDAPLTSPALGNVGEIFGRYTERETIWLQVALSFGQLP